MKTKVVTIYWDDEKDLTTYKLSPEFDQSDWITRLDILKDTIYELEKLYDKELNNERR